MADQKLRFNTLTIHGGQSPEASTGAIMPPVFLTSTYAQSSPGVHQGYEYSRSANPTRTALENAIASLEGVDYGLAFASGLAAIDAVIKLLEPGDEVISTNDLYGGTYRLFQTIFAKYGIKFHFVPMGNVEEVQKHINAHTRLIWVETPTNPTMKIIDIAAMAQLAHQHDALLVVDNTFATPYLQRPVEDGADIVMHSATKYLGGHSDVILGLLAVRDQELAERLYYIQNSSGAVAGPMDAFLVLRGIKTLHVRVQRHCENGRLLAHFLREQPAVEAVYWPGFESHPNHAVARRQMKDFGGMISFTLKEGTLEQASRVVSALQVFTLAESLGGVESLAGHPATMTHAAIPVEERLKSGVTDSLIRLSVGIEDGHDLQEDLANALAIL